VNEKIRKDIPWSLYRVLPDSGKMVLREAYSYLNAIAWVWPLVYIISAIFFTDYSNIFDPLVWRTFPDPGVGSWNIQMLPRLGYSNHHFLNFMILGAITFVMAWYCKKNLGGSIWKYGLMGATCSWLIWAIHEGYWWITFIVFHDFQVPIKWFTGFGNVAAISTVILFPVLRLYWPKRFIGWMLIFYVIWFLAGFPTTESYTGNLPGFNDPLTNAWEIASWAWAGIGFYWLERKGFIKWFRLTSELIYTHA